MRIVAASASGPVKSEKHTTTVKPSTLNPVWSENFELSKNLRKISAVRRKTLGTLLHS